VDFLKFKGVGIDEIRPLVGDNVFEQLHYCLGRPVGVVVSTAVPM
jgi:hypothetical protein